MEREALKLALEALEGLFGTTEQFEGGSVAVWRLGGSALPKQAITAIKEALAQPEQEPVAWRVSPRYEDSDGFFDYTGSKDTADTLQTRGWTITPLYAQPYQLAQEPYGYDWSMLEAAQESLREHMARIHELEAALAQPAQEPVARVTGVYSGRFTFAPLNPSMVLPTGMALYSTPQHTATWVGLTDEDKGFCAAPTYVETVARIEAKLKEKNT